MHLRKTLGAELTTQVVPGMMTVFQIQSGKLSGTPITGSAVLDAQQIVITLTRER